MANEGIFITKDGTAMPAATEMPRTTWDSIAGSGGANLFLGLIQSAEHEFEAFEAFKYRLHVDSAVNLGSDSTPSLVAFNNVFPRTLSYVQGTGSSPQTTFGDISIASVPAQVEPANTVFLNGSTMRIRNDESNFGLSGSIRALDNNSHLILNLATGAVSKVVDTVEVDTDTLAIADNNTIEFNIGENGLFITNEDNGAETYSTPRTFTAVRTAGSTVLMASSGTATGNATAFNATETFQAQASSGTNTVEIRSNFGQTTVYTVYVGTALVIDPGVTQPVELTANQGEAFSHDLADEFNGGVGLLAYGVAFGESLPAGLSLNSSGQIVGTPTVDVTDYEFSIGISDSAGQSLNIVYNINIAPVGQINYSPPNGSVGSAYSYTSPTPGIVAASLALGVLPNGLSLNTNTSELSGTPTVAGDYSFSVEIELASSLTETIPVEMTVFGATEAELIVNGEAPISISNAGSKLVQQTDDLVFLISEGSGSFQYSISGNNVISSDGVVQLFDSGSAQVNIIDLVTGNAFTYTLQVAGQGSICGLAVEEGDTEDIVQTPCVDVVTDCNTPVTIGFNGLHILRGLEPGDAPYRIYPLFTNTQSAQIQNNGRPFVMFRSTAAEAWAFSTSVKDGKPFVVEFAVDASVANNTNDVAIGITKEDNPPTLVSLEYAVVISSVGGQRSVEIRKDNVYQTGSRVNIAEGQQVGFGVFTDRIVLYVDGVLQFTLTSQAFSCSEQNLVFFAEDANMVIGGKAGNLLYDIDTPGTPEQVGIVNSQTGEYTPSLGNMGLITISGTSTVTPTVKYFAKIRVIRPATRTSLEKAMVEGVPVDLWIADTERGDDLPLRLGRDGSPDKNQVFNAYHLGTLVGSAKIENTLTRNDFRNDVGATSSSTTVDKAVLTGAFLAVRRFDIVKRLVPFMKETNSHGVRQLHQMSTGCHKKVRMLMIWQSPECDETPVFDAIEIDNGLSYTPFSLEVGKAVQSNIPITIEAFPNKDGVIFHYNQYDKHFHRIGDE